MRRIICRVTRQGSSECRRSNGRKGNKYVQYVPKAEATQGRWRDRRLYLDRTPHRDRRARHPGRSRYFRLGRNYRQERRCGLPGRRRHGLYGDLRLQRPEPLGSPRARRTCFGYRGGLYGGPYFSSWPSNPTHYAFAIFGGTLLFEYPGPASGTAWASTTAAAYTVAAGTSAYWAYSASASRGTGAAYSGPRSCAGVV